MDKGKEKVSVPVATGATEAAAAPAQPEPQGRARAPRVKRFANRSKTGCLTCRKRRVRCDEGKPTCAACIRVGRTCAYEDPFVRVAIRRRGGGTEEGVIGFSSSSDGPDASSSDPGSVSSRSPTPGGSPGYREQIIDLSSDQVRAQASALVVKKTPYDAFFGTPFEIPIASRPVLQNLVSMRQERRPPALTEQPFILEKMFTNPGYLHAALLMGCVQRFWAGTPLAELKVALATHRLAACRFVNEQLSNRETAKNEHTTATLTALGVVEGTMYDCIGFDMTVADTTARAVNRVLGRKQEAIWNDPGEMTALSSLVIMLTSDLPHGDYDIRGQSIHALKAHGPMVAAVYYPIPLGKQWLSWPDEILRGQSQGWEWRAQQGIMELAPVPQFPTYPAPPRAPRPPAQRQVPSTPGQSQSDQRQTRQLPHRPSPEQQQQQQETPQQPPRAQWKAQNPPQQPHLFHFANRSQTAFFLTTIYLVTRHPRTAVTSFTLQWFIEMIYNLLVKVEPAIVIKRFRPSRYLWVAIYGGAAAVSMVPTCPREERERQAWQKAFVAKMRWVSGLMGLKSWGQVEDVLMPEGWKREFLGKEKVVKVWEDAVLGPDGGVQVEEVVPNPGWAMLHQQPPTQDPLPDPSASSAT